MDKCDLYEAAQKVAAELPDGFEIKLNLEKGYVGVELTRGYDDIDISNKFGGEETMAEQVLIALETAKNMEKL